MKKLGFEPKNIIVRMPNWIGDLVMATPVLQDLKEKFPKAKITAMCRYPICELLEENKYIDEVFCFEKPERGFFRRKGHRDIIMRLKEGEYDLGILLTYSFSSAWWFFQGNVGTRLGYSTFLRFFLLNLPVFQKKGKRHLSKTYKMVLKPLGIGVSDNLPVLTLTEKEKGIAQELLYQRGYRKGKRLVGISPSATYGEAKCWPKERFRQVAKKLLENKDLFIVFFGDARSSFLVKEICQGLDERALNLVGVTS